MLSFFRKKSRRIRVAVFLYQQATVSRKSALYKRRLHTTAKKIESFERHVGSKLYSSDWSAEVLGDFIYYLTNNPENYRNSTIMWYVSGLKTALRRLAKRGYKVNYSFEEVVLPRPETIAVALSDEEILRIYNCKNLSKEQRRVSHLFLLMCCTALRFSDLERIGVMNILGDNLQIRTKKTNEVVIVPLHWIVRNILSKNENILRKLTTSSNFNKTIKGVCRKAGIIEEVLIERHEGGKMVRKSVPKYTLISSHTGRRSFATNAYLSGIPVVRIMLLTGHKTEMAFFRYICIEKRENARILANHDFFKGNTTTFVET